MTASIKVEKLQYNPRASLSTFTDSGMDEKTSHGLIASTKKNLTAYTDPDMAVFSSLQSNMDAFIYHAGIFSYNLCNAQCKQRQMPLYIGEGMQYCSSFLHELVSVSATKIWKFHKYSLRHFVKT